MTCFEAPHSTDTIKQMSYFRKPKKQNERKEGQKLLTDEALTGIPVKGRVRSGKGGRALPTDRSDKVPSSKTDRSKGKKSYSPFRKAKAKSRGAAQ